MNDTNARIRKLRKTLDLTQAEFAARIGTTANVLTHYETGRRNPSRSVINNICKEFHVSEQWLRTGTGEMFWQMSREEEIAAFVGDILANESAEFKRRFLAALIHLDETGWKAMEQFAIELVKDLDAAAMDLPAAHPHKADDPPPWEQPADQHAIWEAEARAEAEQVYREVLEEKRAPGGSSPSGGQSAEGA